MKAKLICATFAACLAIYSCHKNESKKELASTQDVSLMESQENPDNEKQQQIPVQQLNQGSVQSDSAPPINKPVPGIDWDKKIIKNATVKLEVKNLKKYNEGLHQKIKQYGGYIAQEDNFLTEEKSESVLTIKVPVQQFEGLINELSGADIKVIERSIKSEDVTGEVVDTRARLEAKKQMRLKYLEFLKQSKNMAEVLQVQDEINDLQEEIESAAGRIQYLTSQSAYSTITLSFYEPRIGFTPINTDPSFFAQAASAFKTGAEIIKNLLLAMISIWPLILLAFVGLYLWRRSKPIKIIQVKG